MLLTELDVKFSLIQLFTNTHLYITTEDVDVMFDFRFG